MIACKTKCAEFLLTAGETDNSIAAELLSVSFAVVLSILFNNSFRKALKNKGHLRKRLSQKTPISKNAYLRKRLLYKMPTFKIKI